MTVREFLAELQHLPRDAEVLAFEAGCEQYCEREIMMRWRCRAAECTCISVPDETTRNAASKPGSEVRCRALVAAAARRLGGVVLRRQRAPGGRCDTSPPPRRR